jgi:ATP-dependent 26S proteasome regulatory subunit
MLERLPKEQVEELVLEEIPDVSYEDIGGLGSQIEDIKDAIELPFLYAELFHEHELKPPKGVLLYGAVGRRSSPRPWRARSPSRSPRRPAAATRTPTS